MKRLTGMASFLFVVIAMYLVLTKGISNPKLFLSAHGLVMVFGGLVIAALASFPWSLLWQTTRSVLAQLNTKSGVSKQSYEELLTSSVAYQKGLGHLEKQIGGVRTPFLTESLSLVLEGLKLELIKDLLAKRIDEKRNEIQSHMNVLLTLSKYSPAMGLGATVLGLVDLLSQLGSADLGQLGYGMAVALTATFYGIIFSNLVFAPLSELIAAVGEIEVKEMEMIKDGIESMMDKKSPIVIGEVMNSHLSHHERVDVAEVLKKSGSFDLSNAA